MSPHGDIIKVARQSAFQRRATGESENDLLCLSKTSKCVSERELCFLFFPPRLISLTTAH